MKLDGINVTKGIRETGSILQAHRFCRLSFISIEIQSSAKKYNLSNSNQNN